MRQRESKPVQLQSAAAAADGRLQSGGGGAADDDAFDETYVVAQNVFKREGIHGLSDTEKAAAAAAAAAAV